MKDMCYAIRRAEGQLQSQERNYSTFTEEDSHLNLHTTVPGLRE